MLPEDQSRKKYVSDLTDEQWTLVAPLLPPAKSSPRGGRPRQVDLREVLNTIRYLLSERVSMGYAAPRSPAEEYRL
jgi:transposase